MEKDIQLGPEAKVVLRLVNGKVLIGLDYEGKQASGGAHVALDIDQYGALLKGIIPGGVDDVVIDALIAVLKAAP